MANFNCRISNGMEAVGSSPQIGIKLTWLQWRNNFSVLSALNLLRSRKKWRPFCRRHFNASSWFRLWLGAEQVPSTRHSAYPCRTPWWGKPGMAVTEPIHFHSIFWIIETLFTCIISRIRYNRSRAAETPGKYERDFIFADSKFPVTEKWTHGVLVTPTPAYSPEISLCQARARYNIAMSWMPAMGHRGQGENALVLLYWLNNTIFLKSAPLGKMKWEDTRIKV